MTCSACNGKCPTPAACELPVAIATKPPRAAFWLHRLIVRTRLALLRFHLDCLVDEREYYLGLGWTGPIYMRESYAQQRVLMTRIRALEEQL